MDFLKRLLTIFTVVLVLQIVPSITNIDVSSFTFATLIILLFLANFISLVMNCRTRIVSIQAYNKVKREHIKSYLVVIKEKQINELLLSAIISIIALFQLNFPENNTSLSLMGTLFDLNFQLHFFKLDMFILLLIVFQQALIIYSIYSYHKNINFAKIRFLKEE